jgi:hypothetical protein
MVKLVLRPYPLDDQLSDLWTISLMMLNIWTIFRPKIYSMKLFIDYSHIALILCAHNFDFFVQFLFRQLRAYFCNWFSICVKKLVSIFWTGLMFPWRRPEEVLNVLRGNSAWWNFNTLKRFARYSSSIIHSTLRLIQWEPNQTQTQWTWQANR